MFRFTSCLAVFVALVAVERVSAVEMVINGGFESPQITGRWQTYYPPPSPQIPGWTVVNGDVDIVTDDVWGSPFEGTQFLDLNGNVPGTIEQTFATTAGLPYRLSFRYSTNSAMDSSSGVVSVFGGAESLLHADFFHGGSTPENMDYTIFERDFVANGTTATLRLESTTPFSHAKGGPALDAFSVTLIPEPSTLVLLCIGVVGLLALRRRRRSRSCPS